MCCVSPIAAPVSLRARLFARPLRVSDTTIFARIDPRFRLSDSVWEQLGLFENFGLAVFQLKPGKGVQIHPMGFRFATRHPDRLFFPTLHAHDGRVEPTARFDLTLYYQASGLVPRSGLTPSELGAPPDADGLTTPGQAVARLSLQGRLPDADTLVVP